MLLLQDTGSQLFYCLLSTLSKSIDSILYLLNILYYIMFELYISVYFNKPYFNKPCVPEFGS